MYCAAVLNQPSVKRLRDAMPNMARWGFLLDGFQFETPNYQLPHHMTINLGKFDELLNDKRIVNCNCEIVIDKIACDLQANACAARVASCTALINSYQPGYSKKIKVKSANPVPHITIAIRPPGKPKDSNDIDWENCALIKDTKILLFGVIQDNLK